MEAVTWTPERDQVLAQRREEGKPFSRIAVELGLSRNACIGRARRLKLEKRPNDNAKHRLRRMAARQEAAFALPQPAAPAPLLEPSLDLAVPFFSLKPHHCRWIVQGWGVDALSCGHRKEVGSSYCAFHRRKSMSKAALAEAAL